MSSDNRPWYQWWPKEFNGDEKVQCLSPLAELIYRRTLDVMWQANDGHLPNNCQKLANALSKGIPPNEFEKLWAEIQTPGFELFKTSKDGDKIYSDRLVKQIQALKITSKKRSYAGKKGAEARAKQMVSNCQASDDIF
jgi:hypothetical protein